MDCCAICASSSFAIKPLYEVLKDTYPCTLMRDAIHVVLTQNDKHCNVFIFGYGSVVFWDMTLSEAKSIFEDIVTPLSGEEMDGNPLEIDEFTYHYGDTAKIFEDVITLPNKDFLTKFAFSQAIAQSVKLGTFESRLQRTFNANKQIPQDLARKGKIPLSRSEIRKKMGELFIERNSINLHMDVLDTPEFFWEYPELEPYYSMTANYLDLIPRVEVLNHRLDVIHGLFEMLGTELNHLHSSRLEWTIIILIVIEVIVSLLRDVFRVI